MNYGEWIKLWQLTGISKTMKALVAQATDAAQTATTALGQIGDAAASAAAAEAAAQAASTSEGHASTSAQQASDSAAAAQLAASTATEGVASRTLAPPSIAVAAAVGATANATLAVGTAFGSFVLQVKATNQTVGNQNYELEFYDGSAAGALLYRSSGITDPAFIDNASFFIPPLASGNLFVLVTNIDANPMTLDVEIKLLGIQ
jgi:hypothetical protein